MARNKPCDPRVGQAEYERCLEDRRARRNGGSDSRLAEALDEVERYEDAEDED